MSPDRVAGDPAFGGLRAELLPGRTYALFCNSKDEPDKVEHMSLGMFSGRSIAATR